MRKLFMAGAICALTFAGLYARGAKQGDSICKKHHEEMDKMLASIKGAVEKKDVQEAVEKIYEYLAKKHEFHADLKKHYGQNKKLCAMCKDKKCKCSECKDPKCKCTKCKGKKVKCMHKSECTQHADKKCSQCKDKKCTCPECKAHKCKCMKIKKCCAKVAPETKK